MRGLLRLCAAVLLLASVRTAYAAPDVYPLSKVHRGQTGYGLTTFAGTTPEKFTFEVVSVVTNFLPKQDIILVKSDDPKMQVSGFWQGMSGSPLYIDDKLVCAFSYGFRFNKIALGGCTPIEYMKHDSESYRRSSPVPAAKTTPGSPKMVQPMSATLEDWRRLTPTLDAAAALDALGPPRRPRYRCRWLDSRRRRLPRSRRCSVTPTSRRCDRAAPAAPRRRRAARSSS